jgi:serine protease AprX
MEPINIICPLCSDKVDKLLYRYHLDGERAVLEKIKMHNPGWTENDGACGRCVDYYHTEIVMQQRILPEIGPHFSIRSADDFVILPIGLRLNADQRFTGKGVTICFIDSGFYLHPDLVNHRNRVKEIVDITDIKKIKEYFTEPHKESWHGTMTSVVCAGDGYLSNGLYKGIASDAELVLLKVQNDAGRITTENIVKALEWVSQNHKAYDIRIVNMSLGDDEAISYKQSEIDKLAEKLIAEGIIIVAAAGNDENASVKPPANSPNVIAVGGIDDDNNLQASVSRLYHSSFGKTIDEFMKPELVAHAIWIAAPILPGTKEQEESAILYDLLQLPDSLLPEGLSKNISQTDLEQSVFQSTDATILRKALVQRIQTCKYISGHYMHVDGTSFAAPVVSAVIAQLLEANPGLSPAIVREVLFSTAKRIETLPAERQGFGVVNPKKSLLKILKREVIMQPEESPQINYNRNSIEFYTQHDCAFQIALAGTFNYWAHDTLLLEPGRNGSWKIEIPMLPAGRYQYKFFADDKVWLEDVNNPYREPDGFSGFNSILVIEN